MKRSDDTKKDGKFKKLKTKGASSEKDQDTKQEKIYFLSKVEAIKEIYNQDSVSLKNILNYAKDEFVSSAHFNYCYDVQWLINNYPEENRNKPLLIVHGFSGSNKVGLESQAKFYKNIEFQQAKLDIPFGTHHTKMILLLYKTGLRIIILTANMIEEDWCAKTQGIWSSPLFSKKNIENDKTNNVAFNFKEDMLEYLRAYNMPKINAWAKHVQDHDLSTANAILIASTPGRHRGKDMWKWGHLKLRKVLHALGPKRPEAGKSGNKLPVIAQFSSIGSLGTSKDAWLASEFSTSLFTYRSIRESNCSNELHSNALISSDLPLRLVFPTVDNVRTSLEGYVSGGSIPYSRATHAKQHYLEQYMYQWKSDGLGRSRASPHIKSYVRLTEDGRKACWFLLTSANLSKAAWGAVEKKGSQLAIRSYELGVLFVPQVCERHGIPSGETNLGASDVESNPDEWFDLGSDQCDLYLPYDYPLTKYTSRDSPWLVDVEHGVNDKDILGNTWPPM